MKKFLIVFLMLIIVLSFISGRVIAQESTLRIAIPEDVGALDPCYAMNVRIVWPIMDSVHNGLVKFKPGTWEAVPDLAEKWEISKDGKEITFWLREGIQFHHGYGEMTAEDVKFSFDRIIDPESESPEAIEWDALDHVEIIDRYKVKLILKEPSARLFTATLPMISGLIVSKKAVEDMGKEKFNFNPVGTGPYEFVHWIPNQEITLTVFKDYWGEPPKIENLKFIPMPELFTAEMALEAGEIDVVSVLSEESIRRFQENPNFKVYPNPDMAIWRIRFNVSKPPLDNIKVREALRYATDVDEIIEAVFMGMVPRAYTFLPPGVLGYWEDAPHDEVNIEKAKKLLAEAGYSDGLTLTILGMKPQKADVAAEVIQSQWKKIGVDLEIHILESGAMIDAAKKGTYHMVWNRSGLNADPTYCTIWYVCDGEWDFSHWCNREYDRLVREGDRTFDVEKRAEIYRKVQKIMHDDVIDVWVTNGIRCACMQKYVDPGKFFPDGRLTPWLMSIKK